MWSEQGLVDFGNGSNLPNLQSYYAVLGKDKFGPGDIDWIPLNGRKNGNAVKDLNDAAKHFRSQNPGVASVPNGSTAENLIGIIVNNKYYAMHHMQDGKTIRPVLGSVHTASKGGIPHTGTAVITHGLEGLFTIN